MGGNARKKLLVKRSITYVLLTLATVLLVFPFVWMISTSFKSSAEIFAEVPKWFPNEPTLENYRTLFQETGFLQYFKNSVIVAISTTIVTLFIAIFFSYGLSRFKFRGRMLFLNSLLVSQMFPLVLLIIPIFAIFIKLDLIDSYLSLIIAYCTFAIPFATLMMKSYFDGIPKDMEEAAFIDGCTPVSAIFRVVIPLAAPGIAAVGLFSFILSWQEFIFALTLTSSDTMRTLPVGISLMVGNREVLWGQLMAASAMVTTPVVIVFIYFQKYLISGMTMGGVKG
ncbi:Inner membrane ABC transporter permease protein ycjP [Chlamydia abortus]|uniref:Carbohydrate ABC transporter permease n=1 Tax=Paenibacillus residui TaxID=629724 RepID=A0ABW3DIA6_9BACL|nr:carbohydrate ABC transporter permease [Paenibacillus sp. 32O-W]SHE11690.1 Inner membrane ABC transporter permease protein ycjP [Chlamydia abortus]